MSQCHLIFPIQAEIVPIIVPEAAFFSLAASVMPRPPKLSFLPASPQGEEVSVDDIFAAVDAGDVELLEEYGEAEADFDCTNSDGNAPLHLAAISDNDELVDVLCVYGATPDMKVGERWTGHGPTERSG